MGLTEVPSREPKAGELIPNGQWYVVCSSHMMITLVPIRDQAKVSFQHSELFPRHLVSSSDSAPNLYFYQRVQYRVVTPEEFNQR